MVWYWTLTNPRRFPSRRGLGWARKPIDRYLKKPVTLVFDIGKTTKKALIFDGSFNVVEEKTTTFPEIADDDGFPAEDLALVTRWFKETLQSFLNDPLFNITHINTSAYGASLVALDENDKLILPFYNYLKPFPETLRKKFDEHYNVNDTIAQETASPWLGMLNSGLQAFWLKNEKPEHFRKIRTLLHLPQYFSFLVTGKKLCEKTSIGCHTMLWDFENMDYHTWTSAEGIKTLFPPIESLTSHIDVNINGLHLKAGTGVHDSSAALMPYLVTNKEPFLLLSTGTWNICFNPFNQEPLTSDELRKDCLCYLTYEGKSVKASRIFLGHEHEVQQRELAKYFRVGSDEFNTVHFDQSIYDQLCNENNKHFYPLEMEGTGPIYERQFHRTDYAAFATFEEAQHQLMRYLVQWQKLSIDLVDPASRIQRIILVGGFTKNKLFIEIVKRELKGRKIHLSDHPRASALGAGWLVNDESLYLGARHLQLLDA